MKGDSSFELNPLCADVYSLSTFPDDEWPGTYVGMATCVALNMGAYILGLVIVTGTVVVLQWDIVSDVAAIHVILAKDAIHLMRNRSEGTDFK